MLWLEIALCFPYNSLYIALNFINICIVIWIIPEFKAVLEPDKAAVVEVTPAAVLIGKFRSRPSLPPFSGHALREVGKRGGRMGGVLEEGDGGVSSGGGGSS